MSILLWHNTFHDFEKHLWVCWASPLIYILEHTVRCMCCGEDSLVRRDSWSCKQRRIKINQATNNQITLLSLRIFTYLMLVPSITFISRVHPLSKQEAAKLFFIQLSILDFHQVRGHAERVVLKIPFALLATTEKKKNPTYIIKNTSPYIVSSNL